VPDGRGVDRIIHAAAFLGMAVMAAAVAGVDPVLVLSVRP
jgi:hypothetical protein